MATLVAQLRDLREILSDLAAQHQVPGASLAVSRGRELVSASAGVTSLSTRVEVDDDTLFQIGSITKVYTATLVMQLVDEGKVTLDEPVRTYLPEFELAVPGADAITVRHLLTHTSGIQGDHFDDHGIGDDAIADYVASMAKLDFVHPTGLMFSYTNSGFTLLGRLVEKVTGLPYARAMHERLLDPAGLRQTKLRTADMLAFRYAMGHVRPSPAAATVVTPMAFLGASSAPAGSLTSATARDVIRFARMHLAGGRAGTTRVLSAPSAAAMVTPQVERPDVSEATNHMGLGWAVSELAGLRAVGHNGGTVGQLAFLIAIPERDVAVCLLTNSVSGGDLWTDVSRYVLDELGAPPLPSMPDVPDTPAAIDVSHYVGTYERLTISIAVEARDDGTLTASVTPSGPIPQPSQTIRLVPADDQHFVCEGPSVLGYAVFLEPDDAGRPQYLHVGGRVARRVG